MIHYIKKFVPYFLIDKYHFFLALSSAVFYGFPSKKIKVIGVTGTNGKSTTIDLISRILEQAGHKIAVLSSIKFKIGNKEKINELRMTMPGHGKIQKFLKKTIKAKCDFALLEITSEGIKQHRHRFIDFEAAILTNLHPEHIEAHGSFENYRTAKGKFFKAVKNIHIINLDDNDADYFLQFPAQKKLKYSLKNITGPNCQLPIADCFSNLSGITFKIDRTKFELGLLGKFNIYNALAAICVGLSQGIDLEICKKALKKAKGIPGRMELVIAEPFQVFVDYAFTPNALEQVYQTLKNLKPKTYNLKSKMICVLGSCGGGRDKWKRPVLGKLAGKYCDKVIITNEDPYDEEAIEIINQVASGAGQKAEKILDRREAIRKALEGAKPGDIVVITGKGCEPSICIAGGKKIPWDDRQVAHEEFKKVISY